MSDRVRSGIVAALVVLAAATATGSAQAAIKIYDTDGTQLLATIDKANCKFKKGTAPSKIHFAAFSLPKDAPWTLDVFISNFDWHGFGADYPLLYGDGHTIVDVFGDGGAFSNEFPIPGTPPGTVGGGGIKFSPNGKKVSIGLAPAPNESYTQSVVLGGAMRCKYPRRR